MRAPSFVLRGVFYVRESRRKSSKNTEVTELSHFNKAKWVTGEYNYRNIVVSDYLIQGIEAYLVSPEQHTVRMESTKGTHAEKN